MSLRRCKGFLNNLKTAYYKPSGMIEETLIFKVILGNTRKNPDFTPSSVAELLHPLKVCESLFMRSECQRLANYRTIYVV